MSGWHRLWILVSGGLAVAIAILAAKDISRVRPVISESTLSYFYDDAAREKAADKATFDPSKPYYLPAERKVVVPPDYQRAMDEAARDEARHTKFEMAGIAFVVWIAASLLLLGVGHAVAWVIRGFARKNG